MFPRVDIYFGRPEWIFMDEGVKKVNIFISFNDAIRYFVEQFTDHSLIPGK
jgi:hypothetical protein